jgi:arylsulfatase A-like enzyme
VVKWPGHVEAGTTSDKLFSQVDMAATLSSLVGISIPDGDCEDSQIQLASLLGKPSLGRSHMIHEAHNGLALRLGKWKYIPRGNSRDGLGPWTTAQFKNNGALYDLAKDESETKDLADERTDVLDEMMDLLEKLKAKPSSQ